MVVVLLQLVLFFEPAKVVSGILVLNFFLLQLLLAVLELLSYNLQVFVSLGRSLNCLSPLEVKVVPLNVKSFELLCSLVQLNLSSLGLCDLLVELLLFLGHENSEVLDLELEFLDLGLVSSSVLL